MTCALFVAAAFVAWAGEPRRGRLLWGAKGNGRVTTAEGRAATSTRDRRPALSPSRQQGGSGVQPREKIADARGRT